MDYSQSAPPRRSSFLSGLDQKWRTRASYGTKEKENVSASLNQDIPSGQFEPELSQLTASTHGDSSSFKSNLSFQQRSGMPPCHQNSSMSSSNRSRGSTSRFSIEGSFRGGGIPFRTTPATRPGSEPKDRGRSSSSVSTLPTTRIISAGPAQKLLKMLPGRHNTKSYCHSSTKSSKHLVSSRAKVGGTTPSVKNSLVRSHTKKKRNETPGSRFYTNGNRNPAVQSVGVSQEEFFRFRSELEHICAERVRISEENTEEKFRRLIDSVSGAAEARTRGIEEVRATIESRVEENKGNLRATKHELEEKLKSYSNEFKSKEIIIKAGIQDIDNKLVEMRDNGAFHTREMKEAAESHIREMKEAAESHTQELKQSTVSHLESISNAGSDAIKKIKDVAEPIYKKCEELCGKLSAWAVNKVTGPGQTALKAPPSQPQPSQFQTSEIQPNSTNRPASSDEDNDSPKVSNVAPIKLDALSRPTRKSECPIAKTNMIKQDTNEEIEESRGPCQTRQSKARQSLIRCALNKRALEENTPPPHPKKACVTPSGGKVKQNRCKKGTHSAPTQREGFGGRSQDLIQPLSRNEENSTCHQGADFVPTTIDKSNRRRKRTRSSSAVVDELREDRKGGSEEEAVPVPSRRQAKSSRVKRPLEKSSMTKESTPPLRRKRPCVTPSGRQMELSATPTINKKASETPPKRKTSKELHTGKREAKPESPPSSGTDEVPNGIPKLIVTGLDHECSSQLSSSPWTRINEPKKTLCAPAEVSKQKRGRRKKRKTMQTYGSRGAVLKLQLDDSLFTSKF